MIVIVILAVAAVATGDTTTSREICNEVDKYIEEFTEFITSEKESLPKGPDYQREISDPVSINAVIEAMGDIQRIFEYVDDKLNVSIKEDSEKNSLVQEISQCESFQDLVSQCKEILKEPECDETSPYRTYDGTCNNLENPRWGSLFAQYERILPPRYKGTSGLAESVSGGPLPEPRHVSVNLLRRDGTFDKKLSHMFMFFGQLITHEITEVPVPKVNGQIPPCCPEEDSFWCDPLRPGPDDPFYGQFDVTCVLFMRHPPFPFCGLGKREHPNTVPMFLDLHSVYGRTETEASEIRTSDQTGHLRVQESNVGDLMSANISQDDQFCFAFVSDEYRERCFFGGDSRINQHSTLMSLETLFTLEHNRIADVLGRINPEWDEERIYQVARKINGAQLQCITYKEYLPHLIGDDAMEAYGLKTGSKTKNHYDKSLIPNVVQEFASVGFRLHSTIATTVGAAGCAHQDLKDTFSNPEPLHEGCLGSFLSETTRVPQQTFGPFMVEDMLDHFFTIPGYDYGIDVGASDIKRGRDHGIPSYADLLSYILGQPVEDFQDFRMVMSQERIDELKANYNNLQDVDSFVGMLMEDIVPGAIMGRTAFNLTVDHFLRQKKADRFYFENQGLPTSFTKGQINELGKCSLSKVICDNTDVDRMPSDPFVMPGLIRNRRKLCRRIQGIDLAKWKDK